MLKGEGLNRILGPALGRAAYVVFRKAKQRGYAFQDRTGRLRKSIRMRRVPGTYGGRKYKRGRAAVFAGGTRRTASAFG